MTAYLVRETCLYCGYGNVFVVFGNGDGTFETPVLYECGGGYPISVAIADINGDGTPDLVVATRCWNWAIATRTMPRCCWGTATALFKRQLLFWWGKTQIDGFGRLQSGWKAGRGGGLRRRPQRADEHHAVGALGRDIF